MSSELVLNWGILSTGLISQDFCLALQSLKSPYHKLKAVASRNLEDSKKFADRFNISNYYSSYDELLQDKEVNIVYIGSINTVHKELSIKAINAGKHVLCEKPMSINSQEQEEVFKAAKEKQVFFMEAIWTRFFPIVKKVKEEILNNSIGDLRYLTSSFFVPIKNVERVNKKELGGGGILDIGIYPIQLICFLMEHEKPIKITASGHLMPSGVDESCSITLLYSNQRIAQINVSTNASMYGYSAIVGEKGFIQIPEYSWCPTEAFLANGERYHVPMPECEPTNFKNSVGLRFQAEAVREAISKGLLEHPLVTHDHSRLIMHIMEEAKRQLGCE